MLTADPVGARTEIRPEDTLVSGTLADISVEVDVAPAGILLMFIATLLFEGVESKFVPFTVIAVPAGPTVGLKPLMVGELLVATVNELLDDADPPGAVTAIGPDTAPAGTVALNCVVLALVTVAAVPPKVTLF